MKKRVTELFAGVGGFRLGFEKASSEWEFVYANQWEPSRKSQWAYDCYINHYGESKNHTNVDINKVDKSSIPNHEVLVGGFPCQDYSVARTQAKGIQGKKGVLWWEIYETLKEKEPSFLLLENVDRLLKSPSNQRGRDLGIMLFGLHQLGYSVEWRVINAAEYGLPQKRRRIFIFGYKNDTNYNKKLKEVSTIEILDKTGFFRETFPIKKIDKYKEVNLSEYSDILTVSEEFKFQFENSGFMNYEGKIITAKTIPDYDGEYTFLRDVIETNVSEEFYIDEETDLGNWKYMKGSKRIERTSKSGHEYVFSEGNMSFPDSIDKPARTMLTSESSKNRSTHVIRDLETERLRLITPLEAERLNGFEDNWTDIEGITKSFRYFCMGNALMVGLVEIMARRLTEIIDEEL